MCVCGVILGKHEVSGIKTEIGSRESCPFVQTKEYVIYRATFSLLGRRGGFDRQDFLSFIRDCK